MRVFTILLDILFPPSAHADMVARARAEDVLTAYRPAIAHHALALTRYRTPLIRALIHEAKFSDSMKAAELLSCILARFLHELPNAERYLLVPIPLSRARLRERGYNQTERIAQCATRRGAPLQLAPSLLLRARNTQPQTALPRAQRRSNLTDAFTVGAHTFSTDTPIIVFDDVTTTGATLAEAARTLRTAGFSDITALALAH